MVLVAERKRNNKSTAGKPKTDQPKSTVTMGDVRAAWDRLFATKGSTDALNALGWAWNNNPYIQNERVKKIATPPFMKDRNSLEKSLESFANSEKELRQTSSQLSMTSYPLMKLSHLYADILSYRNYFFCRNATADECKTDDYKKERSMLRDWIDLFQPKRTFQSVVLKAQREGKVAYYMRDSKKEGKSGFNYVYLQELPSDYIKIVGWNSASKFMISFNFAYFWQPGTSPNQFPPIFAKYFNELNQIIPEEGRRRPNARISKTLPEGVELYWADNQWFYWHILPMDECFVFSQDESNAFQVPNAMGLFLQAQDLQDYMYLQQQLLQLPLTGVITGTLPMVKNMDNTTATDGYALSTDAFAFFTNMFNSVAPQGIQLFLDPATDHKFFKFDGDVLNNSAVVTNALQQFNSVASVGGLNSTTDKPNIMQVKTQQILEAEYVAKMYEQFSNCINVWWKNKLGLKYTWCFKIKGSVFADDNDFSKIEKGLSLGQNYLLPEYLSFFDLSVDDIASIQEEIINTKVYDKFQVLLSAYTQTKQTRVNADTTEEMIVAKEVGKDIGRPNADIGNIESDGTATSIGTGTNTADGRAVMQLRHCVECGIPLKNKRFKGCFCSEDCYLSNIERTGGDE